VVEEVVQVVLTLEMIVVAHNMVEEVVKVQRQEKEMMEVVVLILQITHMVVIEVDRVVNKIMGVQKEQQIMKVLVLQYKLMVEQ
tara:strand:- start:122 stop:373 length:252 start_codon:yes stop_codon:yes gene_type:complete